MVKTVSVKSDIVHYAGKFKLEGLTKVEEATIGLELDTEADETNDVEVGSDVLDDNELAGVRSPRCSVGRNSTEIVEEKPNSVVMQNADYSSNGGEIYEEL